MVTRKVTTLCTVDVHFAAEPVTEYLAKFGITVMNNSQLLALLR